MKTVKPWQSKTIWMNSIIGVLLSVSAFVPAAAPAAEWIKAHFGEIGMAWSFLAIALRIITKGKISLEDQ